MFPLGTGEEENKENKKQKTKTEKHQQKTVVNQESVKRRATVQTEYRTESISWPAVT